MTICIRRASVVLICAIGFLFTLKAQAGEGAIVEGQLLKPDGNALEDSSVIFKVQIRSPGGGNCLMYEETRTVNMAGSGGNFKLKLGDGATPASSNSYTLRQIFANRGTFNFNPGLCDSGSTYIPASAETRNVVVSFKPSAATSFESLPTMDLGSVPFAMEAAQVGGFESASLLRVMDASGTSPGLISPLSSVEYTTLTGLISGTSTMYEQIGKLKGLTIPTLTPGHVMEWDGAGWISRERLEGVRNFAKTNLPSCPAGQALSSDGANFLCLALPISGPGSASPGSAGMPSYNFASDNDTGFYQPASDTIGVATGGIEIVRFASNGNVGIGTNAPMSKLHLFSNNPDVQMVFQNPMQVALVGLDANNFFKFETQNNPMTFVLNGVEKMRLVSGRLGIGTANPQGALHVSSGAIVGASTSAVSGPTVDFTSGNIRYTTSSCQAFNLYNLKEGTVYKLAVLGGSATTCSFNGFNDSGTTALTRLGTGSYSVSASSKALFTFTVIAGSFFVEYSQF